MHYFRPAVAVHAEVSASAEAAQLTVRWCLTGDLAPGRVNRTGLSDPVDAADELRRLLTFTISPGLLAAMRLA